LSAGKTALAYLAFAAENMLPGLVAAGGLARLAGGQAALQAAAIGRAELIERFGNVRFP